MASDTSSDNTTTQMTAENLSIEGANGIKYVYRRFGIRSSSFPPLVLLQHFRGNLDNWDPLLVDTLAKHREIILMDNTGVGLSSGVTPSEYYNDGSRRDCVH
jgi:pimeloyl-ACP methyl ester carboxylesterase